MDIKAIVYTSNTGYTAEYAKMLSDRTGLPLYTLAEAKALENGTPIIYMSWLMAGTLKDYNKAAKCFDIRMAIGSCLGTTGSMDEAVRKSHKIPESVPVFTVWGGFDMKRLHGIYKLLMKIVGKAIKDKINKQETKSPEDLKIIDMLDNGGSAVDEKYLEPMLNCYNKYLDFGF